MANHISVRRDQFRETIKRFPKKQRALASAFFMEALMRANWCDGECVTDRDVVELKRGQFVMGRSEFAEYLGCTEREFRTIKSRFETIGELTTKPTNKGTISTIVYYDSYTNLNGNNDHQNDQQTTSKRPANDHSKDSKELKPKTIEAYASMRGANAPLERPAGPPPIVKNPKPQKPDEQVAGSKPKADKRNPEIEQVIQCWREHIRENVVAGKAARYAISACLRSKAVGGVENVLRAVRNLGREIRENEKTRVFWQNKKLATFFKVETVDEWMNKKFTEDLQLTKEKANANAPRLWNQDIVRWQPEGATNG